MENLDKWIYAMRVPTLWQEYTSGKLTWSNTSGSHIANGTYVYCKREGKRRKPPQLTPRYGTTAFKFEEKRVVIDEGLYERWPTASRRELRQFPYNQPAYGNAQRMLDTLSVDDMVKMLDNKAIAKIMDGSGQLAVDLLELNKSRRMMSDAIVALLQGFKDLRRGQPLRTFVKTLKKEGWDGLAGRKFLEFVYGWSPTVEGAFETAETLSQDWVNQKVYVDSVASTLGEIPINMRTPDGYFTLKGAATLRGKAKYQYKVSNPKLALMKHLGLTNPASIAWEKTPWSFVFDWAFQFGSYLDMLDWDLGKSDIWIQHSVTRHAAATASANPSYYVGYDQLTKSYALIVAKLSERLAPRDRIIPSWKGVKNPYQTDNVAKRLAISLALLNQQRRKFF